LVTWPVLVARVTGSAKNARYASECPSSKKMRFGPSGPFEGATRRILARCPDAPSAGVATPEMIGDRTRLSRIRPVR